MEIGDKMEKGEKIGLGKKVGLFFLMLLLFFGFITLYSRFIGTTGLKIKEYKITNEKLPSSFYGLKIVHISDLHYGRTVNTKQLDKVVKEINLLKPDVIVLTGDLLDQEESLTDQDILDLTKLLSKLNTTIGKFAIAGEDDFDSDAWSTIIKESNFVNLNDTYELIYFQDQEPILIAGLSTNLKGTKNAKDKILPINDYIASIQNNEDIHIPHYKILLMHEPDYVDQITPDNFDLILAGHSHNGQIRFPFLGAIIKPVGAKTYYDEYYQLNQTDFYISSGLGTSEFDFRLWNRPSINFYRLTNK